MSNQKLPPSGPLPRPRSLAEAAATLRAERIEVSGVDSIFFRCDEFTSTCPRTRQPDFGSVEICFTPDGFGLESKALKFYLWAFRDEGMFCEALAARIADDVFAATGAKSCKVVVKQNARGGIALEVLAAREKEMGA